MQSSELQDWVHVFKLRNGRFRKTGRPLFEYRVTDREFEELGQLLLHGFGSLVWRSRAKNLAPMFCLWAAEWWARKFEGGSWKWEPLLEDLHMRDFGPGNPEYGTLQELVESGLAHWGREVKRVAGNRQFLRTLALEGGLPLRLLVGTRGDNLKRYLRALIGEMQRYADRLEPQEIAQRLDHHLPQSFRIAEVHELAAELVLKVRELQRRVGDATDPVAALDAQHPAWRQEFPLRVDDDVAATLLTGLVREAAEVARRGTGTIRVLRELHYTSAERKWAVSARLDFPARVGDDLFQNLFPGQSAPTRFELCLDSPVAGAIVTARGYRRTGGEETTYDLDPMQGSKDRTTGDIALKQLGVLLRGAGEQLRCTDLPGGSALAIDVPWVFQAPSESEILPAEADDAEVGPWARPATSQTLRLIATGSCALRTEAAIVSVAAESRVELGPDATWQRLGIIAGTDRELHLLKGRVRVADADGSVFLCRTAVPAAEATESGEIQLYGPRTLLGRETEPVWLGTPQVRELRTDQMALATRDVVQWKPSGTPGEWRQYNEQCLGDVRLRVIGRDGAVRCQLRARVVPAGASVGYSPSTSKGIGEILFRGFRAQNIALVAAPGVTAEAVADPPADVQALRLQTKAAVPPAVTVTIFWSGARHLDLTLPFPVTATQFEDRRGRPLAADETIAATTLDHYRAFALSPNTQGAHFAVEGDASGRGIDPAAAYEFALYETLAPENGANTWKLDLSRLRRSIDLMLDLTSAIDTACRLRLVSSTGMRPAVVNVRRYDIAAPAYAPELGPVLALPEESCTRLDGSDYERLSFEAVCLTDPDRERVRLESSGPGRWWLPECLMNGEPWIVLGWDGQWARVRPRIWSKEGNELRETEEQREQDAEDESEKLDLPDSTEDAAQPNSLHRNARAAARVSDLDLRKSAFRSVATTMAQTPSGDDWSLFDHHLAIAAEVGPQCLELVQAVARFPDAAAYAAVRCTDEPTLDRLWRTLEHLPFAWRLIPAASWKRAFITRTKLFETLGEDGAALMAADFDRLHRVFTDRAPWLCPLIDQARARAMGGEVSPQTRALRRGQLRGWYAKQLEDLERQLPNRETSRWPASERVALVRGRASRDARWPRQFNTNQILGPWKDVLNTPTVSAAHAVWGDLPMNGATVASLRRLAAYDQDWFEQAYEAAFLFLCPELLEDSPS